MHRLNTADLPAGVTAAVGVHQELEEGGASGKRTVHVVVELDGDVQLTGRQIYQLAVDATLASERTWEDRAAAKAMDALGVADSPQDVFMGRPSRRSVTCTWVRKPDVSNQPVLGASFHFDQKERVRGLWSQATNSHAKGTWWPEAKLWLFRETHYAPVFFGLLEDAGFKVSWSHREGLPPPPAIQRGGPPPPEVPF